MLDATDRPETGPERPVTELGPAHNWCDRQCDRCPLASGCVVWQAVRVLEQAAVARGDDPDDVGVVLRDVASLAQSSIDLAVQIAEREGLDLDLSEPPRPRNLLGERLRRTGLELADALRDLLEAPAALRAVQRPDRAAAAEEILYAALLLPAKVARLGRMLRADGAPAFEPAVLGDAAANLLLLDHIETTLLSSLDRLGVRAGPEVRAFRRAHARLTRLLAPLRSGMPSEPRIELEALRARGRAPSPFCVEV